MHAAMTAPSPPLPPLVAAEPGDPQGLSGLRPAVRGLIACVLGRPVDDPDVEDCAQEALARAMEGMERLREGEALRPWVLGIARHVALDALRRARRDRRTAAPGGEGEEGAGVEVIADTAPGPEERAAGAQWARRVEEALGKLPQQQREALVAYHVEGQSYQDIARGMGIPLGTVATWIARGRRCLAEALGE